ncbi:MAG: hypothetical protein QM640_00055 [Niabella sp.]
MSTIAPIKKIAVIYLAWLPYGLEHLTGFLDSYKNFKAGYAHELIIALNGISLVTPADVQLFLNEVAKSRLENYSFQKFEKGQDIFVYSKIADTIDADYILCLNSFSVIKSHNWLKLYVNSSNGQTGVTGATGSYASYPEMEARKFKRLSSPVEKFRLIKYLIKLKIFYNRVFPAFPNPHIRTTGFFIKRNLFLSLEKRYPKNKMEAYYFENGINSMTRQLLKKGLHCIVIDKYGSPYDIDKWRASHTFWVAQQENLLIADNRTGSYDEADDAAKKYMETDAWGR